MEITNEMIEENKTKIIELLKSTNREGIEELIKFLEVTDFFTAPASTRFHLSVKGGLALHSLHVYEALKELKNVPMFELQNIEDDSIILVSLLHDICKVQFYKESERNVKDETGKWIKVPFYQVENQIVSVGEHGDKSLVMVLEYIKLSPEEKAAIRWHMGAFEGVGIYNSLGLAYEKYPLAHANNVADGIATHRMEANND